MILDKNGQDLTPGLVVTLATTRGFCNERDLAAAHLKVGDYYQVVDVQHYGFALEGGIILRDYPHYVYPADIFIVVDDQNMIEFYQKRAKGDLVTYQGVSDV